VTQKSVSLSARRTHIRVACWTSAFKPRGLVDHILTNAGDALAAIQSLQPCQPDIICLPENFLYSGIRYSDAGTVALSGDDSLLDQFRAAARSQSVNIALPFLEHANGRIYNSVTIFNRNGTRIGTYRKRYLWPSSERFTEFEYGVVPGLTSPIIDTEFGPVGVQICIEVNWLVGWTVLRKSGVRLILYPSEQRAGVGLHFRAWDLRAYIVSAVSKGGPSSVINPLGKTIALWGPDTPHAVADFGLDFELVHLDHNDARLRSLRSRFREQVEISEYEDERVCIVTSRDPTVAASTMLAELGILPLDGYLEMIRSGCDESMDAAS
jgi:predicted amidohydrolase